MRTRYRESDINLTKDAVATSICNVYGGNYEDVRKKLDLVQKPEDLFGENTLGLKEFNAYISSKSNEYDRVISRRAM